MTGPVEQRSLAVEVSAVVINWNGKRYLPDCLAALSALEPAPAEIIVVDNASTDGSQALLAQHFPAVRVLTMSANLGPAAARNAGMRAARTRYVLALDNDVLVPTDVLTQLLEALHSRERVAMVEPRSLFRSEPQRVHYDAGLVHHAGLIALRNFYVPQDEAVGESIVEVDAAVSLCLLVDRELLLRLGGYDESYFILFEDLDLSYRLRLQGYRILAREDCLVLHDAGTAGISFREGQHYPAKRVFYHSRNRWLYLLKCYRWRTLCLLAPSLLAYELVWLVFALRQGAAASWLQGKLEIWSRRKDWLAKRKQVQATRQLRDRELLVAGPLTVTPALRQRAMARIVLGALDAWLRGCFLLLRPFLG